MLRFGMVFRSLFPNPSGAAPPPPPPLTGVVTMNGNTVTIDGSVVTIN